MKKILIFIILILALVGCKEEKYQLPSIIFQEVNLIEDQVNFILEINDDQSNISSLSINLLQEEETVSELILELPINNIEDITFYDLLYGFEYEIQINGEVINEDKTISNIILSEYRFVLPSLTLPTASLLDTEYSEGIINFDLMVNDPDSLIDNVEVRLARNGQDENYSLDSRMIEVNELNEDLKFGYCGAYPGLCQNSDYTIRVYGNYTYNKIEHREVLTEYSFSTGEWINRPNGEISNVNILGRNITFDLTIVDPDETLLWVSYEISNGKNSTVYTYPQNYDEPITLSEVFLDMDIEYLKVKGFYSIQGSLETIMLAGKGISGITKVYEDNIYFQNVYENNNLYRYNTTTNTLTRLSDKKVVQMYLDGSYLYYVTTESFFPQELYRINLDTNLEIEFVSEVRGINIINIINGNIYYNQSALLKKANLDFSEVNSLISLENVSHLSIYNNKIYFIYNGFLHTINTDGSGLEKVVDGEVKEYLIENGVIYYRSSDNLLYKVNADKTGLELLLNLKTKSYTIYNNKIYYYNDDETNYGIYEYIIDSKSTNLIYQTVAENITFINDNIFYYKSSKGDLVNGDGHFYSINLDGTNETLIS